MTKVAKITPAQMEAAYDAAFRYSLEAGRWNKAGIAANLLVDAIGEALEYEAEVVMLGEVERQALADAVAHSEGAAREALASMKEAVA